MNTQPAGAVFMARGRADAAEPSVDLLQAALHHLLRHSLLGCPQSAGRAAWLLDLLAEAPRLDGETRGLCERMSAGLGRQAVSGEAAPMCERHPLDSLVRDLWAGRAEDAPGLPLPARSGQPGGGSGRPRAAPTRRRKLWELESKYLCPVVGTCLTLEEIKRVARRRVFRGDFDDYRLHVEAVSVSGSRNSSSEVLHKTLERKHQHTVKDFDRARDDAAVAELWRRHLERGEVAGALWAVMSHKSASPETRAQAYADVHMLSHQVGAGQAADARRLVYLEGELARQRHQAGQDSHRMARELAERADRIRVLEAEVQGYRRQRQELDGLRLRLEELESGQALVALGRRLLMLEAANGELRQQAGRLPEAEARLDALRQERDRLKDERDGLLQERDALERLLLTEPTPERDCRGDCSACPDGLRDRCVLCVGGRTALLPQYRQLAGRLGVRLIHHDGGREEALSRLPELLAASDAVICPTDCVSHPAYYQVKKHCKQVGKPCVLTPNSGLAGFAAALQRLAEGRVDISPQPVGGREMNAEKTDKPAGENLPAPQGQAEPPVVRSEDLFNAGRELVILHEGQEYRLRLTRQNKLILTK